jgi:DNA repair protein RadD
MMDLRPYQVETIEQARARIREGAKRVLLIVPTGGGKTVIASEIINSAQARGSRVLFLAHRRELILQTCDKLNRFGVRHGVVMAGERPALHLPVQVASVQTLARRTDALTRVDLIFLDEAHHVTTENQYSDVLKRFPTAKVVGLTATPWRLDGKGLADVFDSHVIGATPRQLRELGFLTPVGGWEYEAIDTSSARVKGGDFVASDLHASATSRRVVGDIISEWLAHAAGKRTVLFATSIEQSQLMVAEFRKAGVPAEHVDGTMGSRERDALLGRLRSGETLVVCNCNVLTEGFDCPAIEVIVLARPTLSTSLALQMIGRGLRPSPETGKTMCRVHDHAGVLAAHGHPYAERDYSPAITVKGNRKAADGATEGRAGSRRCPSCKSVIACWPCDACGYAPDPKELKLEYDPAAVKREITGDGVAAKVQRAKAEQDRRRAQWVDRYEFDTDHELRRAFFLRMVERHGRLGKAKYVYRWVSGESEWPKREWVAEAEAQMGVPA